MIISFIYYVTLSKFVNSSFPQCNVHIGVQGGCLTFTPLEAISNCENCLDITCHCDKTMGVCCDVMGCDMEHLT